MSSLLLWCSFWRGDHRLITDLQTTDSKIQRDALERRSTLVNEKAIPSSNVIGGDEGLRALCE